MSNPTPSRPSLPPGTRPGEVPGVVRPQAWPPSGTPRRRLGKRTRAVLRGVAEASAPRDRTFQPSATQIDTAVDRVDELMARMDRMTSVALAAVTAMLDWSCILRHGKRFPSLAPQVRERVLSRWQHSRMQPRPIIANQLVGLCQYGFFSQPTIEAEIGYVPHDRVKQLIEERLKSHGAPPL